MLTATSGTLQNMPNVTPQQLLEQHRYAVYTSAVIQHGRYFLSWQQHLERLHISMQRMSQLPELALQVQHPAKDTVLAQIMPSLKTALTAGHLTADTETSGTHARVLIILHTDAPDRR